MEFFDLAPDSRYLQTTALKNHFTKKELQFDSSNAKVSHLLKITKISFYHSESISDNGGERTWDCVKKPFQVIIVI